jgi:hypothetical protein
MISWCKLPIVTELEVGQQIIGTRKKLRVKPVEIVSKRRTYYLFVVGDRNSDENYFVTESLEIAEIFCEYPEWPCVMCACGSAFEHTTNEQGKCPKCESIHIREIHQAHYKIPKGLV